MEAFQFLMAILIVVASSPAIVGAILINVTNDVEAAFFDSKIVRIISAVALILVVIGFITLISNNHDSKVKFEQVQEPLYRKK